MEKTSQAKKPIDAGFDLPPIPGAAKPVNSPASADIPTPTTQQNLTPSRVVAPSQYASSTAIQQMQEALQNLYGTFKNYPMFNKKPDYRETDKGQAGAEYTKSYEHGNDTFLTSMLNRHVSKSDVAGVENLSGTNTPQNQEEGKFSNLIQLIETLKTFGRGSNKPDGSWGPYTNNALKNLYAITQAMVSIMNNLNLKQDVYTNKDLEELKENIPADPKKLENANKSAITITKNIAKIKMLLGSFVNGTTGKDSKLTPYINQQKPFETTFGKKPVDSKTLIGQNVSQSQVPVLNIQVPKDPMHPEQGTVPLLLGNLATAEDFKEFVDKSGIMVDHKKPEDKESMNKIIETIENKIRAANTKPTTNQPGY